MGDLEIMEMFLLEPRGAGGGERDASYTESPADLHETMQHSSQVHAGRWVLKRTPLLP